MLESKTSFVNFFEIYVVHWRALLTPTGTKQHLSRLCRSINADEIHLTRYKVIVRARSVLHNTCLLILVESVIDDSTLRPSRISCTSCQAFRCFDTRCQFKHLGIDIARSSERRVKSACCQWYIHALARQIGEWWASTPLLSKHPVSTPEAGTVVADFAVFRLNTRLSTRSTRVHYNSASLQFRYV